MGLNLVALFVFFLSRISNFEAADSAHFRVTPSDVELKNDGNPVVLRCEVMQTLNRCEWRKGGNKLDFEPGRYEIRGDLSAGECNLHIIRPQIGIDTTFWQCEPVLTNYEHLISNPARVVAKSGVGNWNNSPYNVNFTVKNSDGNKGKVTLEGQLGKMTRIRWFENGELVLASTNSYPRGEFSYFKSDLSLTSIPKQEPLMIHCCIEIQTGGLLKIVFVGAIYVAVDSYDVEHSKPLKTLPYKLIPPRLRLVWTYEDKSQNVNDNRVIIRTTNFAENQFSVQCIDDAATPTTYLRWGLSDPNGDADVVNEKIEFLNDKTSNGSQQIKVKVRFVMPNRHISLQCQSGDVVHAGIYRSKSAVITVREHDACHWSKSGANPITNFYFTLILISIICHLSPVQIII